MEAKFEELMRMINEGANTESEIKDISKISEFVEKFVKEKKKKKNQTNF